MGTTGAPSRRDPRSARRSPIVLVTAFGLVAACSGGSDSTGPTIPPIHDETLAGEPTTVAVEPTGPQVTTGTGSNGADLTNDAVVSIDDSAAPGEVRALIRTIDVGETVRYAGFEVQVDDVSVGFDPAGFAVALVSVTLTNLTPGDGELQTAIEIVSQRTTSTIDRSMLPTVPSGGTAEGAVSIRLDPNSFTFDDAVLFVGRPDRQRAQIPLGTAGELVTLAPMDAGVAAVTSDDVSTITIDRVVIGWDTSDPRGQAEPGRAFLTVTYMLESQVNTAFSHDSVVLVLPDGAIATGEGGTIGRVDAGVAFTNAEAFAVADPPAGDYVLRYTERFDRGIVEVPFSIG